MYEPALAYTDYGAPKASVANYAAIDPVREERAFAKWRSTELEPQRVERILPSIEIPSRLQKVTSDLSGVKTSNYRSLEAHGVRAADGLDQSSPPSSTSQKVNLDQPERLNFFKRRKFNLPDEHGQEVFEINTRPRDGQRSILIPVEHHTRRDEQLQGVVVPQRTEDLQTLVVENQPAPVRSLNQTHMQSCQDNAPLYMHPGKDVVKIRDEPSYHSQVLLSPGLFHSNTRSHNFQSHLNNQISTRMSASYESNDPYTYLQRHDLSSKTDLHDLRSTARDMRFPEEEKSRGPVFGQPSYIPSYHEPREGTREDHITRVVPEQRSFVYPSPQHTRVRRYLPLESSFDGLEPPTKNARLDHRNTQTSTSFRVPLTRPSNTSLYQQISPNTDSSHESPGYRGQGTMPGRMAVSEFYHDNRHPPESKQQDERR